LGLSEREAEGVVSGQRRERIGRVVAPREAELDRQGPPERLHFQARAAVLRREVREADVAAVAEADDLDVVTLQVGVEVAFARRDDRRPARWESGDQLGLRLSDPFDRAQELEVDGANGRDHPDVRPRDCTELGDLADTAHSHLHDRRL
jgi:hypothetical protein